MNPYLEECYRKLGVAPYDSFECVRLAYRRLVKNWHPDKHPIGSQQRLDAEEKIKELNLAFEAIESAQASIRKVPGRVIEDDKSIDCAVDENPEECLTISQVARSYFGVLPTWMRDRRFWVIPIAALVFLFAIKPIYKRWSFHKVEIAAQNGKKEAQASLAIYYYSGSKQDLNKAAYWARKAAEQSELFSQYLIGELSLEGNGIPQNYTDGFMWMKASAEQGFIYAAARLGDCFQFGWGTTVDYLEAYKWYSLAASSGPRDFISYASKKRDEIASRLNSQELLEAQRRAKVQAQMIPMRSDLDELFIPSLQYAPAHR